MLNYFILILMYCLFNYCIPLLSISIGNINRKFKSIISLFPLYLSIFKTISDNLKRIFCLILRIISKLLNSLEIGNAILKVLSKVRIFLLFCTLYLTNPFHKNHKGCYGSVFSKDLF